MVDKKYKNTVILIGPCRSGKTTLASILSRDLSRPHVSLDAAGYDLMKEIYREGDQDLYLRYLREQEYDRWFAHTRRYELHVAERVLSVYQNCVVDFGAGHSVYDRKEDRKTMEDLLRPYENVLRGPEKNGRSSEAL
jgi:shikimate kinase